MADGGDGRREWTYSEDVGKIDADGDVYLRYQHAEDGSIQLMLASLDDAGLEIRELDEGEIAAVMGGSYEKVTTVATEHLAALGAALGVSSGEGLIAHLATSWSGTKTWRQVAAIESSGVPYEQDHW